MRIANKDGFRFGERAYLIGHEFGLICVSYGNNEQEALDNAVDDGYMDSERMADSDYKEYESNGWYDSFIYAGMQVNHFGRITYGLNLQANVKKR